MSRSTESPGAPVRLAAMLVTAVALASTVLASPATASSGWRIGGTISDWDSDLIGTTVTVVYDDGTDAGQDVQDFTLTAAAFTSDPIDGAVWGAGRYTLYFDVPDSAEFIDGYLGEVLDDEYADARSLTADGSSDLVLGAVTLVHAQYLEGTLSGAGTPLAGADVEAIPEEVWNGPVASPTPFATTTAAGGAYSLKVAAGRSYVVRAFATGYLGESWDDHPACGCHYDPVTADAWPAPATTGVDFDLVPVSSAGYVAGTVLVDVAGHASVDTSVFVHLYRQVTGGWLEVATEPLDGSANFAAAIADAGEYRLRFSSSGDWLKVEVGVTWRFVDPASTPVDPGVCAMPLGFLDPADNPGDDVTRIGAILFDASVTGCGPEPAISTSGTDGTPRPRPSARPVVAVPEPTPTPTPTSTPTASPRPSSSPSPTPTAPAEPTPTSAPDLSWIVWLIVVVALLAGVAVLLVALRRR